MFLHKDKRMILLLICVIILIVPYILLLDFYVTRIHHLRTNDYMETNQLICEIYEINLDDTVFYIEGGAAQGGVAENYTRENKYLYFKNNLTEEMYVTRIGAIVIGDKLTAVIDDGNDYSIAGFAAKLDLSPLDIYNNSYSIYCGEQNSGINMITDTFYDIDYGELK